MAYSAKKFTPQHRVGDEYAAKPLRAAIYARYSSEGNSPLSASEQIERIRYRLQAGMISSRLHNGRPIVVDEQWVIKDEAETGRVSRDGYELFKAGLISRDYDIGLVDDMSRLTRDLGSIIDLYEMAIFHQVEIFSVSDNISTADQNAKDLFVFKGYANEAQSKNISKNTIRGLELRAIKGFSTGHNPYAYYSVATKTLVMKGLEKPTWFEIKVDYEKATNVLRVWREFAEGKGCRLIARGLNDDQIPTPKKGSKAAGQWTEKTIWNMVNQEKYLGRWKYRQTRVIKNPSTDKLVQQGRPENEHIISEREDLRIIPRDLERRVNERRLQIEEDKKKNTTASFYSKGSAPKHLFVGSLKCAGCSGNFIIVTGKGGGYLGCINAHRESLTKCMNKQMIRMARVEEELLDELKVHLEKPSVFSEIAKKYNEYMGTMFTEFPRKLEEIEMEIFETKKKIGNYERFIGEGNWSDTIATNLKQAEQRLKNLQVEQDYLRSKVGDKVYITPAAIRSRMLELGDVLGLAMPDANTKIRHLFPNKITMKPVVDGTTKLYVASGAINLYGMIREGDRHSQVTIPMIEFSRTILPRSKPI